VDRVGGMEEQRGRAGGVERRYDLLRHDGTLSNAGQHQAARRCGDGFHTSLKISGIVEAVGQGVERVGFDADGALGDIK